MFDTWWDKLFEKIFTIFVASLMILATGALWFLAIGLIGVYLGWWS